MSAGPVVLSDAAAMGFAANSAALPIKALKCCVEVEDDDTTDAGSDIDSVCASTQASDSEDCRPRALRRPLLSTGGSRRLAQAPRFRSALATIPGTPVSRPPTSCPPGNWTAHKAAPAPRPAVGAPPGLCLLSTGSSAPTKKPPVLATQAGLLSTGSSAPAKKPPVLATQAGLLSTGSSAPTKKPPVLATQAPKQRGPGPAPQKVALPAGLRDGAQTMKKPLDPAMPAKKKPLFDVTEGSAAKADASVPLKKRVTSFLVRDAQRVLVTSTAAAR